MPYLAVVRWVGDLFILLGLWGIGNRQRRAFLASIIGECCWILAAYASHDWALFAICIVFCGMALRSYVKWA